MRYITSIDEQDFVIDIIDEQRISLNGEEYDIDFDSIGDQPIFSLILGGDSYEAFVYPDEGKWQVLLHGRFFIAHVEDERERKLQQASKGTISSNSKFYLKAPMPGLVIDVPVKEGQDVKEGDILIILESMKMQNELRSPRDGVVTNVKVLQGESIEQNKTLLIVE